MQDCEEDIVVMCTLLKIVSRAAVLAVLAVLLCGPAHAVWDTTTSVSGTLGTYDLHSWVTDIGGGIYQYNYSFLYESSANSVWLTAVTVGNAYHAPYFNGTTSATGLPIKTYKLTDSAQTSVIWSGAGSRPLAGNRITLTFQSYRAPTVVNITFGGSGRSAAGQTYSMLPEPGSVPAIVCGLVGMGSMALRRRRRL